MDLTLTPLSLRRKPCWTLSMLPSDPDDVPGKSCSLGDICGEAPMLGVTSPCETGLPERFDRHPDDGD